MAVRNVRLEQQATRKAQAGMAAGSYCQLGQLKRVGELGWLGERCIFSVQQNLHHPRVTPVLNHRYKHIYWYRWLTSVRTRCYRTPGCSCYMHKPVPITLKG